MIPRDCHGPLRGLAMTSLTAGSMREGFLQSFPTGKLGRNQQERLARDFSSSRGLESAGVLCVLQTFQTDELAENIRHLPQRISSEFSQQGSSEEISKSGWREIFRRGEVWGTQAYFVYSKPSKPMNWQKISGICRRGFLQSFPNREAQKKSARAEGERFFVEARFGERRNTLCISSSPNRWIGGKAPASAADDFFRVSPQKRKGRCDC